MAKEYHTNTHRRIIRGIFVDLELPNHVPQCPYFRIAKYVVVAVSCSRPTALWQPWPTLLYFLPTAAIF